MHWAKAAAVVSAIACAGLVRAQTAPPAPSLALLKAGAAAEPHWQVTAPIFNPDPGTGIAAKDPSLVYSGGKYHLFYTFRITPRRTETYYAAAPTLQGLNTAQKVRVGRGAAPEVFYCEPTHQWFLIQNGTNYSTNPTLGPSGWTEHGSICNNVPADTPGPIDPWVICDKTTAYLFYARDNGTINMTSEPLSLFPSPNSWGPHKAVLDMKPDRGDVFEADHTYKSRADRQYYMEVEGLGKNGSLRKFSLYTAPTLHGDAAENWKLVGNRWAVASNLAFSGTPWTNQVSHPEAIRSNVTQDMEIGDINHSYWIFMGVSASEFDANRRAGGGYGGIPWHLGLMHNGGGPLYPPMPAK